jgi:L-gulonolactone oxidase
VTIRPVRSPFRFVNWGRTDRWKSARLYEPADEAEVVELVRMAASEGVTLKAVGSGHAWSRAAWTDGWMVSLRHLRHLVHVDLERHRVTVQAGIQLRLLNEQLARRGLALRQLGSISAQTLAGATSTGTHGTGVAFGNLATDIVGLTLVTGDARLIEMTEETHGEDFRAARQGLGALGLVVRVTLQCRPYFRMIERNYPLPFDEALSRLDRLLAENEHLKLYWFPYHPKVKVITYNPTKAPPSHPGPLVRWFEDKILFYWTMTVLFRIGYALPFLVPALNRFAARVAFKKERFVERSDDIYTIPMPARHDESEYAIPAERAAEALGALRELIEGQRLPVNYAVEVRWVAADDNPLSPTWRRAGCYLGAYTWGKRFTARYFPAFWDLMARFEGRPHLGKTFDPRLDEAAMRRLFPDLDAFNAARRRLDPRGRFETPFVRRLLGSVATADERHRN